MPKSHTLSDREAAKRLTLIREAARKLKIECALIAWEESETALNYSEPLRIMPDLDEEPDAIEA